MRRVIIVGAGPCGLVALKELLAKGHDAVVLEKSARLGGVFASPTMYSNLHLTISNWAMAFSDFPDTERLCYPTGEHYLQYLKAYAAHFCLDDRISYNSDVCSASLDGDGRWSLEVRQDGGQVTQMHSDALIVATGANQVPKRRPAELAGFNGRVLHSADYSDDFKHEVAKKNLRILVVGGGESGADISAELADLSIHVSVWLRRPACIGPRYLNKKLEMEQVEANKLQDYPANGFLEAATTNRMSAALNVYGYGIFRRILWHTSVLNRTMARMCLDSTVLAPFMNDQATYVTKNQRMCEAIHDGKLEPMISAKVSAQGKVIKFFTKDGKEESREFDAVVLCTGFTTDFGWLKVTGLDSSPRSWFLHCIPDGLERRLFLVGHARPHQGGIPVMAEMLSRYIALILTGERKLPKDISEQAYDDKLAELEYYHISPHLHTLVDYNAFLESIARRIGCEPRLPAPILLIFNFHVAAVLLLLLQVFRQALEARETHLAFFLYIATAALAFGVRDGILIKWWFYPCWAAWYRQRGPDANPALPESTLRRVPLWKSTAITRGFVLLVVWSLPAFYVQRILSMLLFVPYCVFWQLGFRWPKFWGGLLRPKLFALHSTPWRFSDLFLP